MKHWNEELSLLDTVYSGQNQPVDLTADNFLEDENDCRKSWESQFLVLYIYFLDHPLWKCSMDMMVSTRNCAEIIAQSEPENLGCP